MEKVILLVGVVLVGAVLLVPLPKGGPAPDPQASATAPARASKSASPWSRETAAAATRVGPGEVVEIERDAQGQFHLDVDVGGETVRFLVDTGADVVALTEDDAERLGLKPDAGAYRPMLQTASGTGMGAPVEIERLTIGGRDLDGVEAVVAPDLPVSLLGQSALRRLGSVTLRGDRLIIAG